jgi:mannitol/fructose-specific phosphotransferase system IIA component (Ntr-type)/predicted DNA-binding transcriptional regulator AlpA
MPRQGKKNGPERDSTMSVAEVANHLSLSASSVYKLARDLKAVRVAGRWAFRTGDVEKWLLKRRTANEPQIEPVEELGSQVRLFSHMDENNIFLDVPESEATLLIRRAIQRAQLSLTEIPEAAARERLWTSILEREALCSTALHPDVAFPHPRDPETCPLGRDHIVIVRAAQPVEFREIHGYRPRIVFLLLARTVSSQLRWEARLSHLLHQAGFVEKLLSAQSPRAIHQVFAAPN